MGTSVRSKYEELKHLLRTMHRVAVAFSGGVDSSLLLFAAIEALGNDNVIALHGRSCLNFSEDDIADFHNRNFTDHDQLLIVDLDPLSWPDFIENTSKRCYYCKRKTYLKFTEKLKNFKNYNLVDGTNSDDLLTDRPGLAVLDELKIRAPLSEVKLTKREIRFLAESFGLENHNTPSNSCFATRLKDHGEIDKQKIDIVRKIEKKLKEMGYTGVRAILQETNVIIQIKQQDFLKIAQRHNRIDLVEFCMELGFAHVLLELSGR